MGVEEFEILQACEVISEVEQLTNRQREVLNLLALGMGRQEIADTLYVSKNTVVTHLTNLYNTLGVSNAHGAVGKLMRYKEVKGLEMRGRQCG